MRFKCCLAVILSLTPAAFGASLPEAKPESVGLSHERLGRIHETMERYIASHQISGAVTLVVRRDRIAHLEAHGLMDLESKKPMAKDSIFRIWSMTKPVAGTAILMLMEEGRVRLNDPVSNFIPEFKGQKVSIAQEHAVGQPASFYQIPAAREITIQDLLTHVSGLGSGPSGNAAIGKIQRKPGDKLADVIPQVGGTPLEFQPGSRWTYSPLAAFETLGRVVEVASGMPFDQFLRTRIFEPLGMKETFFHPGEERWPRVVTAYHRGDNELKKTANPDWLVSKTYFSGGGGLLSTAEDYARFAGMLLDGGQGNGHRLLSPRTVELMGSVFVPDTLAGRQPGRGYGLSVQVTSDPIAAGQRVSKGTFGWDGAYGTHFWIDPKEKLLGILMIQTDNPNRQLDRDFENAVMQAVVE
jgi:CubicO group peptidase (beta-lactamase class C family)